MKIYAQQLMSAFGKKRTSNCRPAMSAFGGKADITATQRNVCFSNWPVEVKRLQAIHYCGVDVTGGLVLRLGLGGNLAIHACGSRGC